MILGLTSGEKETYRWTREKRKTTEAEYKGNSEKGTDYQLNSKLDPKEENWKISSGRNMIKVGKKRFR